MAPPKPVDPLSVFTTLMVATIGDHIPFYFRSWNQDYAEQNVQRVVLFLTKVGFKIIDVQPITGGHVLRAVIPDYIDKPTTFAWLMSFFDKIYAQQERFVGGDKKAPLPQFKNSSFKVKGKNFVYGTLGLFNVVIRGRNSAERMFKEARKLVETTYVMTLDEARHPPTEKEEADLMSDPTVEEPRTAEEPPTVERAPPKVTEQDFPSLTETKMNPWKKTTPEPIPTPVVEEKVNNPEPTQANVAEEDEWIRKVKKLKDAGLSFTIHPDGSIVLN